MRISNVSKERKRKDLRVPDGFIADGKPVLRKSPVDGLYYWLQYSRIPVTMEEKVGMEVRDKMRFLTRTMSMNMFGSNE